MIRAGEAPRALQISPGCVAWRAADIAAFQEKRAMLVEAA
jgi:predicted DNA-binding transcriptional regulator AlpA